MYYFEIIITVILVGWAIFFVIRHLSKSFDKKNKNKCFGCDFAKSCKQAEGICGFDQKSKGDIGK